MAYEREEWHPVTGLGKLVASGEIKNIDQVLESGRPIKEPQIVDMFLPDLEDEVLDIAMMQRMTDSGRRVQFRAVVIVGNRNGYIGFGQGKDVQVGNAIK
jgi:small subunit ribosomal protein S5